MLRIFNQKMYNLSLSERIPMQNSVTGDIVLLVPLSAVLYLSLYREERRTNLQFILFCEFVLNIS